MKEIILLIFFIYSASAYFQPDDFSGGFPDHFNLDFIKGGIRREIYNAAKYGKSFWEVELIFSKQIIEYMNPEFAKKDMVIYACRRMGPNDEYSAVCWAPKR